MTIGLGTTKTIDSLRIIWPDDRTQKLENVSANQFLQIKHVDAEGVYTLPPIKNVKPLLKEIANPDLLAHKENSYNDFDYEGLIYKLLSQEYIIQAPGRGQAPAWQADGTGGRSSIRGYGRRVF